MHMYAVRMDVGATGAKARTLSEVQQPILGPGTMEGKHAEGKVAREKRPRKRGARHLKKYCRET